MANPGGTGILAFVISPRLAFLPPTEEMSVFLRFSNHITKSFLISVNDFRLFCLHFFNYYSAWDRKFGASKF